MNDSDPMEEEEKSKVERTINAFFLEIRSYSPVLLLLLANTLTAPPARSLAPRVMNKKLAFPYPPFPTIFSISVFSNSIAIVMIISKHTYIQGSDKMTVGDKKERKRRERDRGEGI